MRTPLCERYLQPCVTTLRCYQTHLARLERSASVSTVKGIYILLATGEDESEEDNEFIRWIQPTRYLSSMMALLASASAADV